jgi:hypothetical protein
LLTFTVPYRLIVPEVSAAEVAGELAADAVGIRRRTLEKRNNSAKLFFIKRTFAGTGFEYNSSEHKLLEKVGIRLFPKE